MIRKSIHHRKNVLAQIRAHRPLPAVAEDIAPATGSDTSIVAALRGWLTAKKLPRSAAFAIMPRSALRHVTTRGSASVALHIRSKCSVSANMVPV